MGILKQKTTSRITMMQSEYKIETFEIKLQDPKSKELPTDLKNRLFVSKKTMTQ